MKSGFIEILTVQDCPNEKLARDRVDQALRARSFDAIVTLIRVETPELAQELHFLGSPSVRVDGVDVEVSARARTDFGLMCRKYDGGSDVAPSVAEIIAAIDVWRSPQRL